MDILDPLKIKIEFTTPYGLLVACAIQAGVNTKSDFSKMLSENGKKELMAVAQSILDQVADKTDFPTLSKQLKEREA